MGGQLWPGPSRGVASFRPVLAEGQDDCSKGPSAPTSSSETQPPQDPHASAEAPLLAFAGRQHAPKVTFLPGQIRGGCWRPRHGVGCVFSFTRVGG